jgi:hypothetical protein
MQIKIYDNTLEYSDEIGFTVAPVGWTWYKVLDEQDYPLHYLHGSDWNHPTISGTYLMACVIYSSIFVSSTEGNPFISSLSESEASYFQEVSDSVVLNDTVLWKITSYIDSTISYYTPPQIIPEFSDVAGIGLRNYPNPFSSVTEITFHISRDSFVEIHIYNEKGAMCSSLLAENMNPGIHVIPFYADGFPAGTYFCEIRNDAVSHIRKMQIIR